MRLIHLATILAVAVLAACSGQGTPPASPTGSFRTITGTLDGAAYWMDVPSRWNGTLLLYSHGYRVPDGSPDGHKVIDAADATSRAWLLDHGYALAASQYSQRGWAVEQALQDQVDLVGLFSQKVGRPSRTIAWGGSMGGLITGALVQLHPDQFAAGLAMCGSMAGSVVNFESGLDGLFVLATLVGPGSLQMVTIADPARQQAAVRQAVQAAQASPAGRARLSLVAAMLDLPRPPGADAAASEKQQAQWVTSTWAPEFSYGLAEVVKRAGGMPAENTSVDYANLLQRSVDGDEVTAMYDRSGLSLAADLAALERAPRVKGDPSAVAYYQRFIQLSGHLARPVLTLHDTGDPEAVVEQEQAYAATVDGAGSSGLLRQLYVARMDHCEFTSAEVVVGVQTLLKRLDTGQWSVLQPAALNSQAAALGSALNATQNGSAPAAFVTYTPAAYPRA